MRRESNRRLGVYNRDANELTHNSDLFSVPLATRTARILAHHRVQTGFRFRQASGPQFKHLGPQALTTPADTC